MVNDLSWVGAESNSSTVHHWSRVGAVDDADGAPLEPKLMSMVHHWSQVGAVVNADGKLSKPSWSQVQLSDGTSLETSWSCRRCRWFVVGAK